MRFASALTLLVLLAGAPLGAQQEGEARETGGHAGHESLAAGGQEAELQVEWNGIQKHWAFVQGLPADEKPEHLKMHRTMLDGFMKKLATHAAEAKAHGERSAGLKEMQASLEEIQTHWKAVQGIEDPKPLETHLAMHMNMLSKLYEEGEEAGVHHEGMEH